MVLRGLPWPWGQSPSPEGATATAKETSVLPTEEAAVYKGAAPEVSLSPNTAGFWKPHPEGPSIQVECLAGLALLLLTLRWSRPGIPSGGEVEDATLASTPGPGMFRAALGTGTWASTSRLQFGSSCFTVCGQD